MTHFPVGIIIPPGTQRADIEGFLADQMAPYNENIEVEPYVCYSLDEAKADIEAEIRRFEQILGRNDQDHNLEKCRKHLDQLRTTTPEGKYAEYVRYHESFNDQGEPISTYNADSKWDWYRIGGRWDGWITGNEQSSDGGFNFGTHHETVANNMATTKQAIDRGIIPHAIITPDGQWHERGNMGWFAVLLTENDSWDSEAKALLARYPRHRIIIVDAHI